MKISIEIAEAPEGQFADIRLCYDHDGRTNKVKLTLPEFEGLFDYAQDKTSVAVDFLLISAITYGVDDLFSRNQWSFNGWTREVEVEYPVMNLASWLPTADLLGNALSFLTGDIWSVSFTDIGGTTLFKERNNRRKVLRYNHNVYDFVTLFSGGLDSLIGAINELNQVRDGKCGLLVSHSDPIYGGPKSDQDLIIAKFNRCFDGKFDHIRGKVTLESTYENGDEVKRDGNQRSRSMVFIALGAYIAQKTPNTSELLIPENGTISVNHPLTPSRSSSLSTRTTHPYFTESLQFIFQKAGLNVSLRNPFAFQTKGQMVRNCNAQNVLQDTYAHSASCGKRGHRRHWVNRQAKQCGVCMPCIYRRAALHVRNWDNETYGTDLLAITQPHNATADVQALFDFLMTRLDEKNIKRNLLVNGSFDIDDLDEYARVVHNSRTEVLTWLKDKGSAELKQYLGIQ